MSLIALITVSGHDRPGITAALTQQVAAYNGTVLDIGQAVIHDNLTLGFVVNLEDQTDYQRFTTDIEDISKKWDLVSRVEEISHNEYEKWVAAQGSPRHIITLLGRHITAKQISEVSELVEKNHLNIDRINRLSGRIPVNVEDPNRAASVELSVRGHVDDTASMHASFLTLAQTLDVDIAIQEDNIFRRHRRLVCFDMDSTLIQTEVINELAEKAGVGEKVAEITEEAMRGELDFDASFRKRLALLEGLDESVLESIADTLPITEGAERLISTLKLCGYKIAILSGGFTYFANHLKAKLGIDYVYANELEIVEGKLTGVVKGEIINGERKASLLRELAKKEGIQLNQVIAVGDGANDLPMLSIAGLGIAFHAKPIVNEQAKHFIKNVGLDGILYFLGVRDRDIRSI